MQMVDAAVTEAVRARTAQSRRDAEDAGEVVVGRLRRIEDLLNAGLVAAQSNRVPYSIRDILTLLNERERLAAEAQALEQLTDEFRTFVNAVREVAPESLLEQIWEAFEAKWQEIPGDE